MATLRSRFWTKVAKGNDDECWLWQSYRNNRGYGVFRVGKKRTSAHRVAFQLTSGMVLDGFDICHTCDNPPCCNPKHLFVGSVSDNMRDSKRKGRFHNPDRGKVNREKLVCKRGHEYNAENTYYRTDGSRQCRACARVSDAKRRAA